MNPQPTTAKRNRGDRMTTAWMAAALLLFSATIVGRTAIPQSWWLSIHILTLGVLTNAILQWSWYFSRSLLRLRRDDPAATTHQHIRQIFFNVALVALIVGMLAANLLTITIAAAGIGAIIAWHGIALVVSARAKLGSRFAVVIRYYMAAAAFLVIGCVYGAIIASAMFQIDAPTWVVAARSGLTLAHSLVNALGWLGLTILGTLVTLWPTMLRTRIDEDAVAYSTRALPALVGGLLIALVGATLGHMLFTAAGIAIYTCAAAWGIGMPLVAEARKKHPHGYATWSALSGVTWGLLGLLATTITLATSSGPDQFRLVSPTLIVILGVGGVLQILVGALTYLMPVVIGGGPAVVRLGIAVLERMGPFRLILRNAGLVLALTTGAAAPLFWLLVVLSFTIDLVMFGADGIEQGRAKRSAQNRATTEPTPLADESGAQK